MDYSNKPFSTNNKVVVNAERHNHNLPRCTSTTGVKNSLVSMVGCEHENDCSGFSWFQPARLPHCSQHSSGHWLATQLLKCPQRSQSTHQVLFIRKHRTGLTLFLKTQIMYDILLFDFLVLCFAHVQLNLLYYIITTQSLYTKRLKKEFKSTISSTNL